MGADFSGLTRAGNAIAGMITKNRQREDFLARQQLEQDYQEKKAREKETTAIFDELVKIKSPLLRKERAQLWIDKAKKDGDQYRIDTLSMALAPEDKVKRLVNFRKKGMALAKAEERDPDELAKLKVEYEGLAMEYGDIDVLTSIGEYFDFTAERDAKNKQHLDEQEAGAFLQRVATNRDNALQLAELDIVGFKGRPKEASDKEIRSMIVETFSNDLIMAEKFGGREAVKAVKDSWRVGEPVLKKYLPELFKKKARNMYTDAQGYRRYSDTNERVNPGLKKPPTRTQIIEKEKKDLKAKSKAQNIKNKKIFKMKSRIAVNPKTGERKMYNPDNGTWKTIK